MTVLVKCKHENLILQLTAVLIVLCRVYMPIISFLGKVFKRILKTKNASRFKSYEKIAAIFSLIFAIS